MNKIYISTIDLISPNETFSAARTYTSQSESTYSFTDFLSKIKVGIRFHMTADHHNNPL